MRVLVFGDSIAYGAWDSEGGWTDRLKRTIHKRYADTDGAAKAQLINLGIGGDTSTKILARLKSEADARFSANWPAVFVFAFDTNDARINDGTVETELNIFESNVREIIETAQTYSQRILFLGIPPVQDDVLEFKTHMYENARIMLYEDALRQIVSTASIPFIEVRAAFEARRPELFSVDRLHPNDAGHELIASLVKPELDKLLDLV